MKGAGLFSFVDRGPGAAPPPPVLRMAPPSLYELCLQATLRHQASINLVHLPREVVAALERKACINSRLLSAVPAMPLPVGSAVLVDVVAFWERGVVDEHGDKMAYTAELLRRFFGCRTVLHEPVRVERVVEAKVPAWESAEPHVRLWLRPGVAPGVIDVAAEQTGPQQYRLAAPELLSEVMSLRTSSFPSAHGTSDAGRVTVVVTDMELFGSGLGNSCAIVDVNLFSQDVHKWAQVVSAAALRCMLPSARRGLCAFAGCPLSAPGHETLLPCPLHLAVLQQFGSFDAESWFRGKNLQAHR